MDMHDTCNNALGLSGERQIELHRFAKFHLKWTEFYNSYKRICFIFEVHVFYMYLKWILLANALSHAEQ